MERRPYKKGKRYCIFCNGEKLTREHVWADWLRNYIPKNEPNHTAMAATIHPTKGQYSRKKVDGDLRSRRLRIVCSSCNNGWMSKIQESAKPDLLPLIKGETTLIDANSALRLAAWATSFTIVSEYFYPDKHSTTETQRLFFAKTKRPPSGWKIWIGNYNRENWKGMLTRFAVPVSQSDDVSQIYDYPIPRPNTQSVCFVVGRLYVFAIATTTDLFDDLQLDSDSFLLPLWPFNGGVLAWPPKKTMSDAEADSVASALNRMCDQVGASMWHDANI